MSQKASSLKNIQYNAKSFIEFLNKSVTPFHAVFECEKILLNAGFKEVLEKDKFSACPGDKCFIKKNNTAIFAYTVGGKYLPGNGFSIIAAHTDSPCLRVKPISKRTSGNFLQVGVSTYGGGLWRTWFDRDLSVAGQVIYQRDKTIYHKLINISRPILSIPNLAIHLDNSDKFLFNKETQLVPLLATLSVNLPNSEKFEKEKLNCSIANDHHEEFLNLIANEASCEVDELLDLDLYLYDVQPATTSGLNEEFISGARLDNLVGTYTSIISLVESLNNIDSFANDSNIRLVACYDNEEVGSKSLQGAESAFSVWLLRRLSAIPDDTISFERAVASSFMISADQSHASHPNYKEKHEDNHRPHFHGGVVVKINNNQRYATSSITHSILKVIADLAKVPLQKICVRNDLPCGSTVGPILSTLLGIQTIDVGCPQLAMHSIRELADTTSISQAITLYTKYFENLPDVLKSVKKSLN